MLEVKRLNRILDYLFEKMRTMKDTDRDLPMRWSMRHMYSTVQLALVIGIKDNLNPELCGIIAALHDIASVMTGNSYKHAKRGGDFVYSILDEYNNSFRYGLDVITEKEKQIIHDAVINHSKKEKFHNNRYVELMKQVDSFDHYLQGMYVREKEVRHIEYIEDIFDIKLL